ncbi:MAG TPA: MarC family protein [archaeon]|nr:MarC family protein [archaeon]
MLLENVSLDFISELTRAIIALFIIVDPFGNIPIFVGLTENITDAQRKKTYNTAMLVAFVLLVVFAFTGQEILAIFGLSIYSFEVAGGILLLIIAVRILISGFHESTESPESLGAVPIAIPLLVGPGAITTTIFNLQAYGTAISILAVIVVLTLTWVILRFIDGIYKVLGKTGSVVIARVMALLIAAIAIQYILTGVTHFIV